MAVARQAFGTQTPEVIGIAVSGGGDSIALLHLMVRAQAERGGTVHAVTVDHGLRPEAAAEARFVAEVCSTLGVRHDTVVWRHDDISGNLPDRARRARYGLIADWARRRGIAHVVVGHTADDRAETFLMELAREAGIDGLTSMRPSWSAGGIHWSRPMLSVGRQVLRDYLRRNAVAWIDDPSNEDERYLRVRARRALSALAPLGVTVEGLARVASNLAVARAELVSLAARAAEEIIDEQAGELVVDRARWLALGPDTRRRLLIAALRWMASAEHSPRAAEVARLEEAIALRRDATLWGCHMRVAETIVRITREPKAVAGLEGPTDALWDGRWQLTGPHEAGLAVRALGADGLRRCEDWRTTGHSRAALVVSPAIWRGEALVSAPLAGLEGGWTAEIVTGVHSFLLSH